MKKIIFIFLVIFTNSCDYYDIRLVVYNKSDNKIVSLFSKDTIIAEYDNIEYYKTQIINSNDSLRQTIPGKNAWSYFINNSSNKKLNVFIVNADTLLKYNSIDSIKEYRLYKRYEYSESELNEMNWTILYE